MEWVIAAIVIVIIGLIVGLLIGSPKPPQVKDAALEVPTTEIGTPIGILFGTRLINSPNVVWWGNLSIIKIKVDPKGKK